MSRVCAVAWREFKHTALTKAFILAAVIGPMVMFVAALVLPVVLSTPPKKLEGRLAVICPTAQLIDAIREAFDEERLAAEHEQRRSRLEETLERLPPRFRAPVEAQLEELLAFKVPEVEVLHETDPDRLDAAKGRVREGELLAVAIFTPEVLETEPGSNQFEIFQPGKLSRRHGDLLENLLARAVVQVRADRAGIDLEATRALVQRPAAVSSTLTEEGEAQENELLRLVMPFIFMMLLWMSTWISGQYLLTTTIEEKANKVMEILLSAVSPLQLMTGKILGQALVGLVMIGIYTTLGAAAADRLDYGYLVPWEKIGYLALYFFMAYFMVAALMASVGSAVNELREAQSLMGPVAMVFMVPFFVWFVISDEPNSALATGLSFVPPITPFVMVMRLTASEPVPLWQTLGTCCLGYATVILMIWMSARIFRVGVLMYGKPPTPRELIKWLRRP